MARQFAALFAKGLIDRVALPDVKTGTYLRNHYLNVERDRVEEFHSALDQALRRITQRFAATDRARQSGTCVESNGAPFCATNSANATAPGGQRADVVLASPTPVASATPVASGGQATPTTAPTASSVPSSVPTASPTPPPRTVQVVVEGFGRDGACAAAARTKGSDDVWRTGPLMNLAAPPAPTTFALPSTVEEPSEAVLLCFATPPSILAAELATLAESDPTVVFVLPDV